MRLFKDLQFWVLVGESRRGLERHTVQSVKQDCHRRKLDVIEGVLFVQQMCRENNNNNKNINYNYAKAETMMRAASEKDSEPSVRFAALMGAADAIAAQTDDDEILQLKQLYEQQQQQQQQQQQTMELKHSSTTATSTSSSCYERRVMNKPTYVLKQ
uniref:Uncharacterized protein n=1 Tax=Cyclophora tenuis TaxID=216820 RepID=A0A7S1GM60_CYCTE|mmetsp:Transcript_21902/g.37254  ORF Transcript_21902/g.37254 Transcript_21902/m.37254 type:complete len:157 (+) Transcript_21902:937-1407(+)